MQTVGEKLRQERERQGLSIKDIERATNIRSAYLSAIETGNYSMLPGEAYVKGFIRNYANTLGLNGSEYVDLYRKSQQPVPDPADSDVKSGVKAANTADNATISLTADVNSGSAVKSIRAKRRQKRRKTEFILLLVLIVILTGAGGIWWFMTAKDTPQQQATPPIQKPDAAPIQQQAQLNTTLQQPSSKPEQTQQPLAKPTQKPVVITAKFNNRSWVQVLADDKQVFEGFPKVGDTITWQAEQKISFKVGNAGAVELTHNGQPLGKLGENGEVVQKVFTAGGR